MNSQTSLGDDGLMPAAMGDFGALAGSAGLTVTCVVTGAGFAVLVSWAAARLSPF
ncbi:MAG: hypothetical protein ACRDPI_01870 [Nocardioidaceae bacterium]